MTMLSATKQKTISDLFRDHVEIDRAVKEGVRQALLRHKLLGQSIVVLENGEVVEIAPEDIQVPPSEFTSEVSEQKKQAG